jgi:hypothetical protein
MKKRKPECLFAALVLLIAFAFFFIINNNRQSNSAESTIVKPIPSNEKKVITYEIVEPKEKSIYLININLANRELEQEVFNTTNLTRPIEKTYYLEYKSDVGYYSVRLYDAKETVQIGTEKQATDRMTAFIPYEKINDGVVGIVLTTTDEEILNKVKQDPENAEKYISTEDTIQKQKIVIK